MDKKDWDKIAEKYHKEVISPFQKGVINPLFKNLDNIKNAKEKVIADIGCGRGEILDILASKFKKVHAIDFSSAMIKIAENKASKENIKYHVRDMKDLEEFENRFDVIISVNSILMPKIKDVKKALRSINSCLKKNGKFFSIFPSMESVLYQAILIFDKETGKGVNEKTALKKARDIFEMKNYDFIKGVYNDEGLLQKFFYYFELKLRLKEAGFKNIKISKVLYPWRKDVSDFVIFPGKPRMWDFFVSAEK